VGGVIAPGALTSLLQDLFQVTHLTRQLKTRRCEIQNSKSCSAYSLWI